VLTLELFLELHLAVCSETLQGRKRYYLALDSYTAGNQKIGAIYTLFSFITFWILYSYLVPISLFVTLEIVKFWQGFVFINSDPEMRDGSGESAKCRNSNLNEDLGKIDYIFSDKTGTLTSNEMRLRLVAIKGQVLGDLNKNLESRPDLRGLDALKFFSLALHDAIQVLPAFHELLKANHSLQVSSSIQN
jgi:phospholipid-transporting ATPase